MNTEPDSEHNPGAEAGIDPDPGFEAAVLPARVHQAAGMVAFHLNTTIADAQRRLEAYARTHRRDLDEVASDVVDRRLRIDL
ncbi:hypothetical protein ACQEU3_45785 [Spirillospora sp. CA-253888]